MFLTLPGEWTAASVEAILGPPEWPWRTAPVQPENVCGLTNVPTESAGFGDLAACCRVHIHPEGLCIHPPGGVLNMVFGTGEADEQFALACYQRLKDAISEARQRGSQG